MRIPRAHHRTLALFERFGLATRPLPMDRGNALVYLRGQRARRSASLAQDGAGPVVSAGANGADPVEELWERTLAPLRARVSARGEAAWGDFYHYGDISLAALLRTRGWPDEAIEHLGLMHNLESQRQLAAIEVLHEEVGDCYRDLVYIQEGADRLPLALAAGLAGRIHYGAQVVALEQDPAGVTIHCHRSAFPWSVRSD